MDIINRLCPDHFIVQALQVILARFPVTVICFTVICFDLGGLVGGAVGAVRVSESGCAEGEAGDGGPTVEVVR